MSPGGWQGPAPVPGGCVPLVTGPFEPSTLALPLQAITDHARAATAENLSSSWTRPKSWPWDERACDFIEPSGATSGAAVRERSDKNHTHDYESGANPGPSGGKSSAM